MRLRIPHDYSLIRIEVAAVDTYSPHLPMKT